MNGPEKRGMSTARVDDFLFGCSGQAHVVVAQAWRSTYHVSVAVDESRKHDAAARVDLFCIPGGSQVFHAPAGANLLNDSVSDENRAVLNQSEVMKIGAAPGAVRSAQR
jgi:hypothetical protein